MAQEKKTLRVKLTKSPIGRSADQHKTLRALGVGKVGSSHDLPDNDAVRGMLFKVKHLVTVENI